MTLKSDSHFSCPACGLQWLPFRAGLHCPACGRAIETQDVTPILDEALAAARFNQNLYGRIAVEYWTVRGLGDRYLGWGFKVLQLASDQPGIAPRSAAVAALMDLNLEEFSSHREHVLDFLEALVEQWRSGMPRPPA